MKTKWIKMILFLFLANSGISQENRELEKPKFTFEDIEEIKSNYSKSLKEKNASEIIIYTKWPIGSYVEQTSKRISYKNHFDIYILWKDENKKSYFLQINNFGVKTERKKGFRKVRKYLKSNFEKMLQEKKLAPQTEQIEYEGKIVEIAVPFVDHEFEYQIELFYKGESLDFKYRPSWNSNKENLQKKQYHFIDKLDKVVNKK